MRKLYILSFFCAATTILFSCKKEGFLGQTQTTDLTEEAVFKDSVNTTAFLTNIYLKVGFSESATRFGNGGLDVASDEAEPYDNSEITTIGFANGSVDANTVSGDAYSTCYTNIRSVNVLLKHLPQTPLRDATKTEIKAEARFLRAWYYSILLKHYGGVPLIGDTVYNYTDKIPAQRASYKDCVDYIISECNKAGADLPFTQVGLMFGRASKGACLALKMRVLLYAASPLFNDDNTIPGPTPFTTATDKVKPLVGYAEFKKERWEDAEKVADTLMKSGAYQLYIDNATSPGFGFQYGFTIRPSFENIWQVTRSSNQDLENAYDPPSRGGHGGGFPYQELVDAFPMADGKDIHDPTSSYDANNPYLKRDPRLEYTVNRDQSKLITANSLTPTAINIYTVNGQGTGVDAIYAGTKTGYYGNKMLDPKAVPNSFSQTARCIPLIRYAEVLLSYAEAVNEFEGPAKAYDPIEQIRMRAGLSNYKLPLGLSQVEMRKVIQNERRLELAFEGHRFWDVRRWKIAPQALTQQMTGLEVQRNSAGVIENLKRIDVRKHGFKTALYLWPLPTSEVAKSPLTYQNPGY